ncbi:MAG: Ig-like domain-containing protein [Gemmatimonadales bacterium]|nr:Ig-like domain-containing protein [Gemmatimonadales bacterium]
MHVRVPRRGGWMSAVAGIVVGAAALVHACGSPVEPDLGAAGRRPAAVALRLAVSAAADAQDLNVRLVAFYRRADDSRVDGSTVVLPLQEVATQQVRFPVDLSGCLSDPDRRPAGPDCPLFIEIELRRGETVVDRQFVGPLALRPGQVFTSTPPPLFEVTSVTVTPPGAELLVAQTVQLAAALRDAQQRPIERQVLWTSTNPAVATVSQAGLVTAVAAGTAQIRAVAGVATGTATVTVANPPSIVVAPAAVTFNAVRNQSPVPPQQVVNVTNGGGGQVTGLTILGVQFREQVAPWFTATLGGTTAPTTLTLAVTRTDLAPGTYQARVGISAPGIANSPQTVLVDYVVAGPTIVFGAASVSFSGAQGGPVPASQVITIVNGGGGGAAALQGLAVAGVDYAQGQPSGWLAAPTLAAATSPTTITVVPSRTDLAPGTYNATVRLTSGTAVNSPASLPVTFTIAQGPLLQLSPATVDVSAQLGNSPAPVQVSVSNVGDGGPAAITGLASLVQFDPGQPTGWLSASPAATTTPTTLGLTFSTASLPAGSYGATVGVTTPSATNSPQSVRVTLTISGTPQLATQSTGLTFTAQVGGAIAGPATGDLTNGGAGGANAITQLAGTVTYGQGQPTGWALVTITPTTTPTTFSVRADPAGLLAGTYNATLAVSGTGAPNTVTVPLTLTVTPPPPVIGLSSSTETFTAVANLGDPGSRGIQVTNVGQGQLTGLSRSISYAQGQPTGWLEATLSATDAPATLTLQPRTGQLAVGTYTATVNVASAVQGVVPAGVTVVFQVLAQPTLTLQLDRLGDVSVTRTNTLFVRSAVAAPAGGLNVALANGGPSFVSLPSSVTIAEGQTEATVTVTGLAAGSALVTASAPSYVSGTLTVNSLVRTLGLPVSLRVPYTQTVQLPANVTPAVPAGRSAPLTLSNENAQFVGVVQPPGASITLTGGQNTANFTLAGVLPGNSRVIVSNPDYGADTLIAETRAIVDFLPTSLSLPRTFTTTARVDFRVAPGGAIIAAPTGGIPVTFVSRNPQCVAAPAAASIPAGQVSLNPDPVIEYGGVAATPCSAYLVATAPNIDPDSVLVNVTNAPTLTSSTITSLGRGLQEGLSGFLSVAAPVGGVTIRIASAEPGRVLVSPNATTPGSASIDIPISVGNSSFSYYVQALDTVATPNPASPTTPQVTLTELSSRYTSPTPLSVPIRNYAVTLWNFPSAQATIQASDNAVSARLGVVTSAGNAISAYQQVRAGGTAIPITFTATAPGVSTLVAPPSPGTEVATWDLAFQPGGSDLTPSSLGGGGVVMRPKSAGSAGVSISTPGGATIPSVNAQSTTWTVSQPSLTLSSVNLVGRGLQEQSSFSLSQAAPAGGITVRLTSSDAGRLLLSPNATTVGSGTLDVTVPQGQSSATFFLQAPDSVSVVRPETPSITADPTAQVSAVELSSRYTAPSPITVTVRNRTVVIWSAPQTQNTLQTFDNSFSARLGVVNSARNALFAYQQVRAGGDPVPVTFTTSDVTVTTVVAPPTPGTEVASAQLSFLPAGSDLTPSGLASGGVVLRPKGTGIATVSVSIPGGTELPASQSQGVNVQQPTLTLPNLQTVGRGLQESGSVSLSQAAPAGGAVIRVTSADPARLLVSSSQTVAGAASVDLTIPQGQSSATLWVQALDSVATPDPANPTSVQVSAVETLSRYAAATPRTIAIRNRAVVFWSVPSSMQTLQQSTPSVTGRLGVINSNGQSVFAYQGVRAGGAAVRMTIASSAPAQATLVAPPSPGVEVSSWDYDFLPGGTDLSPSGLASGGAVLRAKAAGNTTLTVATPGGATSITSGQSQVVSITQPTISLSALSSGLGAGLMESRSVSLSIAVPVASTLTLQSSDPNVLLLSTNATTAGAAQITIPFALNQSSATFWVHGVDNQRGNIAVFANVSGYTEGSQAYNVVQPAAELVVTSSVASTAQNQAMRVVLGVTNPSQLNVTDEQVRRAGAAAIQVTVTNSNTTAADLLTNGVAGASGSLTIAPNTSRTPASAAGFQLDPKTAGTINWSFTIDNSGDFQRVPFPNGGRTTTVTSP